MLKRRSIYNELSSKLPLSLSITGLTYRYRVVDSV